MKVFISWSGDLSKQVAELLAGWIEDVLQGVQAWISTEDIEKGSIWFTDVANQLAETQFGILVLTRENMDARWILFEAGALSKGLSKSRVCPLLVDLPPSELKPPLSQFNCATTSSDDLLKLLRAINIQSGSAALTDEKLQKAFQKWWDDFATKLIGTIKSFKPGSQVQRRSTDEILEELLGIARNLQAAAHTDHDEAIDLLMSRDLHARRDFLKRQLGVLNAKSGRTQRNAEWKRAAIMDALRQVEAEIDELPDT